MNLNIYLDDKLTYKNLDVKGADVFIASKPTRIEKIGVFNHSDIPIKIDCFLIIDIASAGVEERTTYKAKNKIIEKWQGINLLKEINEDSLFLNINDAIRIQTSGRSEKCDIDIDFMTREDIILTPLGV